jgi:phospholipid N-methyltransferase
MVEKRSFIKNFWKEKKMVGSMTPSSRFLAKKMLEPIDFKKAKVLVELGPGTGVFTRKILSNMQPDAVLLVFELNDAFMAMLHKEFKDPRVILIHDSAEKIGYYLEQNGLQKADAIISSLPLANFPESLKLNILKESHRVMSDHANYVQFQYSLNAKNHIKRMFKQVHISFTPANFPPAFVYTCKK